MAFHKKKLFHTLGFLSKNTPIIFGFFLSMLAFFTPVFVLAALPAGLQPYYDKIILILNAVVVLLIGIAFVVFLWGVYKYITTASLDGKAGAKETIIYGLIGLFVMLAAWGLVNVLLGTFGFTSAPTGPSSTTIPKAFR